MSDMSDNDSGSATTAGAESDGRASGGRGVSAAIEHMSANKTETGLWLTRMITLIFTFLYLIPIVGSISQVSCYQKALIASAATSALRLHQRLPGFRFTREFLAVLVLEDSAHYLLYSIVFIYNYPISLALLPIALFSFLHFSSFSLLLVDKCGQRGVVGNGLSVVVEYYQRSILQTVALTEIMLMPCIVFAILGGVGSIITPFIYYRFLSLRYTSRRNPYTRNMFHELRLSTEYLIYKPQCPLFLRSVVLSAITLISRLSPPMASTN